MKHYSTEARAELLAIYDSIVGNMTRTNDGKYIMGRIADDKVYYQPGEDESYPTPSGAFNALPYDAVKIFCAGWTGIQTGAITYEALVEYADEFAIAIPTMAQYNALLEDEDDDAAYEMFDKVCEKVLEAIADGLIDTWHSSCVIRGKRNKTQK